MTRKRTAAALPAALSLGVALILPISATAQITPGPGLSSGSGEGTGTGYSSGVQRNRSGSISGSGPGVPGSTEAGGVYYRGRMRTGVPDLGTPAGPGATTTFPDDPTLFPFTMDLSGARTDPPDLSQVRKVDYDFAKSITDPDDRCLTLHRLADVAAFAGQLALAHRAVTDATEAVFQIQDPIVRDLRLISLITTLNNLGEAHLRGGKIDLAAADLEDPASPLPKSAAVNRETLISRAEIEWQRGAYLASRITNPTYRNEMRYRVVNSESYGSQTIANEFPRGNGSMHSTRDTQKPDPLDVRADRLLVLSAANAETIERPVWRDRAKVAIAYAAAASRQYSRGIQITRTIPQPEVRTDALVKIAEAQAKHNDPKGATSTYHEAATAVASIPLDDPRAVLTGVLIDNLISVGRFEDARATVALYPDKARRLIALGAIAESQGTRGVPDSAIAWINRDMPPEYRPTLLRRVEYGVLQAIQANRSHTLDPERR